MEEHLVSSIINLISDAGYDTLLGIKGKFRLFRLKRRLHREMFERILKTYGNKVFYNDLDQFLTKNDVICNIIRNCTNVSVYEYKSQSQLVMYYVQRFVEEHPNYARYHYDVRAIIQNCFEVVFNSLNRISDENTRVICNIAKELANGLNVELEEIKSKLNSIDKRISAGVNSCDETPHFDSARYLAYIAGLYPSYSLDKHLPRQVYNTENKDQKNDILDILTQEKHFILLGEAGFGKTYESISLLNRMCFDERTKDITPVFFSLKEYGTIYESIRTGILYKIAPFCAGNVEKHIDYLFASKKIALIFDGIDEIGTDDLRAKFFIDINDYLAKYPDILCSFSSRFNQYHGELGSIKQYNLTGIDEMTVRREFQSAGIIVDIPKKYFQLFSNPYFLSIGKNVLQHDTHNRNRHIFNRSQLFSELFLQLYDGMDYCKGRSHTRNMTYSEALSILGHFAYDKFYQPSYSVLEFDRSISELASKDRFSTIASFISSGLFLVTDRISFTHKLLKEFCTAYYLVSNFPVQENYDLYIDLIQRDEWKEVFIFASGLWSDVEKQNVFLDFVMSNNLPLYIECVYAKSDVAYSDLDSKEKRTNYLLSQIINSYKFIIHKYLDPIADLFEPQKSSLHPDKKIGIYGCLSDDGKWLSYWFDLVPSSSPEIECVCAGDLQEKHETFERNALLERRNIASFGVNLDLSGLSENSGRYIAIDIIKRRLKEIIDKKLLLENDYLLCERIASYQKKIKPIRGIKTLTEIKTIIQKIIDNALKSTPDIVGYNYDGVDLFFLRDIVDYLCQKNVELQDCILPGSDKSITEAGAGWIWDFYSKEQQKKRTQYFFYFHQLSYLEMVKMNFPNLYSSFLRVKDSPYQSIIWISHNENNEKHGFASDPSLFYYYVSSSSDSIPLPKIIATSNINFNVLHEKAFEDIQNSYLKNGKKAHRIICSNTGFSFTLTSRRTGSNDPLSDYVYASIQESIEEVFGTFT